MLRATEFERAHPTVVRHALMAAAIATYIFVPDDVVWGLVRDSPSNRLLERVCFLAAALLIGAGAVLCTQASALPRFLSGRQYLGEFLYATGFASLVPLWGAVLLVCGEGIRLLRLLGHDANQREPTTTPGSSPRGTRWLPAFRMQAAKWGIFASMILFTVTLSDRLIEVLAVLSGAIWVLLNLPAIWRREP